MYNTVPAFDSIFVMSMRLKPRKGQHKKLKTSNDDNKLQSGF
jgi:hypothetical protein